MGYPKYDKEEAKRVYEEAQAEYKRKQANRHPADKLDDQVHGLLIGIIVALGFIGIIGLVIGYLNESTDKRTTVIVNKDVRVIKYKLLGGKSSTFVVDYYTLDTHEPGQWETKEIFFNPGDTISIQIKEERE